MTYFEWNSRIHYHFFGSERSVVYLSVTKKILAEISGLDESVAYQDFINSFSFFNANQTSTESKTRSIQVHLSRKGNMLAKAMFLKEMWRNPNAYTYLPGPGLSSIPIYRSSDPPPYVGFLACLVLISENSDIEDEAYWPAYKQVFPGTIGTDYMNDILNLFSDLKKYDPRFDHFSIYDVRKAVGTIYGQNPIRDIDVQNLTGFFQAKRIPSIEMGSIDDDSLMELLREELDETIVNRHLLEAILSEDERYERFKDGLPGILRKRIGQYELDEDDIIKAQTTIGNEIEKKRYEVLYCFNEKYLRPNLPFRFLIETGINSPLNEKADDGVLSINAGGSICDISISYSAKTTFPGISKNMTPFDGKIHRVDGAGQVKSYQRPKDNRFCLLFTPAGHDLDLNGWFVERRQGVLMAGEKAYLLHKVGDQNAENLLAVAEWIPTQIAPGDLQEGWRLCTINSWTNVDSIGKFRLSREKRISLSGGVRTNTRTNDFYISCPPILHVRNATSQSELLLSWEGYQRSVHATVSSEILRKWPKDWPLLPSGCELVASVAGENRSEVRIRMHEPGISSEIGILEFQDGSDEGQLPIAMELNMDTGNRNVVQSNRYGFREEGEVVVFETPPPRFIPGMDEYDRSRDRLLAILSDRGVFSRRGFMSIAERMLEFLPEIEGEQHDKRPEHLLEALLEQGHIRPDRGNPAGSERYRVISPVLCLLPDGENRYLLTGARSEKFMSDFYEAARMDGRKVIIENSSHPLLPQIVSICIGTWNVNHKIPKLLNVTFGRDFGKPAGIRLLNGMRPNHVENEGEVHLELRTGRLNDPYLFDIESLGWRMVTEQDVNQEMHALVEIRARRRGAAPANPFAIRFGAGWRFKADRSEALYLFLANSPGVHSCIYYDEKSLRMAIPMGVRLPFEIRRALHLSGCFSQTLRVKSTGSVIRNRTVIHSRRPLINGNDGLVLAKDTDSYCTIAVYENVHIFILKTIEWFFRMKAVRTNIQFQNMEI